jgi:hypothetical protein
MVLLVIALALAPPSSASVLAPPGLSGVVPGEGDSAPFGVGLDLTGWQEIYDASVFGPSPITIAGIRFFRSQVTDASLNTINNANYTITLITTTLQIDQLDPTSLPANATSSTISSGTFFSGTLSGKVGPFFTISPSNPSAYYTYDPSQGNLLLYITKTGDPNGPSLFLDYASGPSVPMSTGWEYSGLFTSVTTNYGLVTQFLTASELNTPEPGTFVPLCLGMVFFCLRSARGKLAR